MPQKHYFKFFTPTIFRYAAKHTKYEETYYDLFIYVASIEYRDADHIHVEYERTRKKLTLGCKELDLMNQVLLFCYGRIINK